MTDQKIFESPFTLEHDLPVIDVPSYIFHHPRSNTAHVTQYFDAAEPSRSFDLVQAELFVKQFARGLQSLGLNPNDKVVLYAPNQILFPVALWGIIAAQCVFSGSSPGASAAELSYQLKDSDAKILIAAPGKIDVALEAAKAAGLSLDKVYTFDPDRTSSASTATRNTTRRSWLSIWASPEEAANWTWRTITTKKEAMDTTAVINYSSGTTGLPKGVELSHFNLVSNVEMLIWKRSRVSNDDLGRDRHARLQESAERWLAALPMYHAFGQTYYAMLAPRIGAKVFIMQKFNVTDFLTFIDIYRITFINVVPTILRMLSKVPNPHLFNLKSLVMVGSGSAPLETKTAREFEKLFLRPGVQVKQGWGMTETTCNVTGFSPDDIDDGRSIGWLNPSCKVRIVPVPDRDFTQVEREMGAPAGEIWVAGPVIMKGYWKRREATDATLVVDKDGRWLRTGDVGYFDQRGCLYIVDRIKELIKVNGLQVSPAEIEKVLASHPGVVDAAVVGVKIDDRDCPRAFVIRKTDSTTPAILHAFIKSRLARHKWISGGIYFLDSLPRTGSGKVIKRALPDIKEPRMSKL